MCKKKSTQHTISTGNILLSCTPCLRFCNWFMIIVLLEDMSLPWDGLGTCVKQNTTPFNEGISILVGRVLLEFAYSSLSRYGKFRSRVLRSKVFQKSRIYEVFKLPQEIHNVSLSNTRRIIPSRLW